MVFDGRERQAGAWFIRSFASWRTAVATVGPLISVQLVSKKKQSCWQCSEVSILLKLDLLASEVRFLNDKFGRQLAACSLLGMTLLRGDLQT